MNRALQVLCVCKIVTDCEWGIWLVATIDLSLFYVIFFYLKVLRTFVFKNMFLQGALGMIKYAKDAISLA
jgi:hypothetical protein